MQVTAIDAKATSTSDGAIPTSPNFQNRGMDMHKVATTVISWLLANSRSIPEPFIIAVSPPFMALNAAIGESIRNDRV